MRPKQKNRNAVLRPFTLRLAEDRHKWLKRLSVDYDRSMQDIILSCLDEYHKTILNIVDKGR